MDGALQLLALQLVPQLLLGVFLLVGDGPADPFPKDGQAFRDWWRQKSQKQKVQTVTTWLILAGPASLLAAGIGFFGFAVVKWVV